MTIQETIQILERMLYPEPWEDYDLSDKAKEALETAIEALEGQIPMKPGMKKLIGKLGNNNVYTIPCDNCGSSIKITHLFCPWCGQAIDWSDVEG